jgi:predicted ATPase/class 3 adenylate cyclase
MRAEAATVTFLFTDLEGSTRLWEQNPAEMRHALEAHNGFIQEALEENGGRIVKYTGDGALAVFDSVGPAMTAALDSQRALAAHDAGEIGHLRARMAIHVAVLDDVENGCYESDGDYLGPALHRCARLMATAHGGQIILSEAATASVESAEHPGVDLLDLGRHRLRDLSDRERVFQMLHADLWPEFPPLRSVDAYPGNLPKQASSFVGRERHLAELAELVERTRLVTLVGVGGVGKTRHAIHTAARLIDRYDHGAWLVDLAPISDPDVVAATVASALRIRERKGEEITDTICGYLADRSLLLLVDNCEQVLDAAAAVISAVHDAAPGVRCVATSREALRVGGEQVWHVPVLSMPESDADVSLEEAYGYESVQLFVDRARTSDHRFVLDESNLAAVLALCRRLDGLPLAIELAAVRSSVMSAPEMLRRLDARFNLLTDGVLRGAEKRQTLRGAIDWSHDLLDTEEQKLFRRLSVFAGGWTLGDAEAVATGAGVEADHVLDLLAGLARKSMVVVTQSEGVTRYRLLESLREYGREQLVEAGEEATYRARHGAAFFELIEGLAGDIRGPGQTDAYAEIRSDLDNIRAAFEWFVAQGDAGRALRFVRVMRTYMAEYLPTEGFQWSLAAVTIGADAPPGLLSAGLADASWIGYVGEREEALSLALRSIEMSEEAGLAPDSEALLTLGLVSLYAGDLETALGHFERATAVARQVDDIYEVAAGQTGACFLRAMLGDTDGAIDAGEEAVELGRRLGYDTQIAGGLASLGFAVGSVDAERSVDLLRESLEIKDDTTYSAVARVLLANLELLLGRFPEALQLFCDVLEVHRTFGDTYFVPMSLEGMASLFALLGRPESGARLLGASEAAREKLELPGLEIEIELLAGSVALVEGALGPEAVATERRVGRGWTLDETIEFALTESVDLVPVLDLRTDAERSGVGPAAAAHTPSTLGR